MNLLRGSLVLVSMAVASSAWAYGEPDDNGSPNHRERLLHVFTNQVRQAPHEWAGWDTSLATPNARNPVALQPGLLAAARFHANDMATNGCFTHESCDGTTTFARINRYFDGPAGENIYTSTGDAGVRRAITGWMTSDGHRRNILNGDWTWLGTGFSGSGRQVYMVQNFGSGAGFSGMPAIVGGALEDRGATYVLLANYFDSDSRAPTEVAAILDGERVPLTRIVGNNGNETLSAEVLAVETCVALTFEAITANNDKATFPTAGELLVGAGCTAEFKATRTPPKTDDRVYVDANDEPGGCVCVAAPAQRFGWTGLLALLFVFLRRPTRR